MSRVARFVAALTQAKPDESLGLRNPYVVDTAARNLERYLEVERPHGPVVLFVGEAPGYRGAVLSGVPFASLATLTTAWDDPWHAFGPSAGFLTPAGSGAIREATATMFWSTVARALGRFPLPLTWNAVPFHPSGRSSRRNGPPTVAHLREGQQWLVDFTELFQPQCVVAVGRQATRALAGAGIDFIPVRHPSHGGREAFASGVHAVAATLRRGAPAGLVST